MKIVNINGNAYQFLSQKEGGPVIVIGSSAMRENYAEEVFSRVCEISCAPFTLCVFGVSDWDADFSPWSFSSGKEGWDFSGEGRKTLLRLENDLVPYIRENYAGLRIFTAGYSLSGLFALWALYESKSFAGACSCSGSLWFSGWIEYMEKAKAPEGSSVYLSLGGKEEKCADPVVSTIGDCTRRAALILSNDEGVIRSRLEMNKGGHFADSAKRLAKGIKFLIEE